jgi:hypothetical protein
MVVNCFFWSSSLSNQAVARSFQNDPFESEVHVRQEDTKVANINDLQSTEQSRIETTVIEYLREKKRWQRDEYRIEHKGTTEDKRLAIVWALYLKDKTEIYPGSGSSVELYVDRTEYRVVEELGFQ